jgi:hypothetical protein
MVAWVVAFRAPLTARLRTVYRKIVLSRGRKIFYNKADVLFEGGRNYIAWTLFIHNNEGDVL